MRAPTSLTQPSTQSLRTPVCLRPTPTLDRTSGASRPQPPLGWAVVPLPALGFHQDSAQACLLQEAPRHLQSGSEHPCPHAGPLQVCPELMPKGEEGRHPEQDHRLHLGTLRPGRPLTVLCASHCSPGLRRCRAMLLKAQETSRATERPRHWSLGLPVLPPVRPRRCPRGSPALLGRPPSHPNS